MENKEGNKDQNYDKLLEDIGAIAQQISAMYEPGGSSLRAISG